MVNASSSSSLSPLKYGKGKRKIEIRKIEKKSSRQVCFSKRRHGLFKKAAELSTLCGVDVAVLVFSPAGNLFSFGYPDVDSVVRRYLGAGGPAPPASDVRLHPQDCPIRRCVRIDVEETKEEEQLQKLLRDVQEMREKVLARVEKLSPPPLARACKQEFHPPTDVGLRLPPLDSSSFGNFDAAAAVVAMHPDSGLLLPLVGGAAAAAAIEETHVKPPLTLSQLNYGDGMKMESAFDFGRVEDDALVPFSGPGSETLFDMFPPLDNIHNNFWF